MIGILAWLYSLHLFFLLVSVIIIENRNKVTVHHQLARTEKEAITLFPWIYARYWLHFNAKSSYVRGYDTTESCLLRPKRTLETAWCNSILGVTGQCWSQEA